MQTARFVIFSRRIELRTRGKGHDELLVLETSYKEIRIGKEEQRRGRYIKGEGK
jgi:hypothetical protein